MDMDGIGEVDYLYFPFAIDYVFELKLFAEFLVSVNGYAKLHFIEQLFQHVYFIDNEIVFIMKLWIALFSCSLMNESFVAFFTRFLSLIKKKKKIVNYVLNIGNVWYLSNSRVFYD